MSKSNLETEALAQGLTSAEFQQVIQHIGRLPNSVELAIFAVMWSEHCCYKSSKIYLKTLPTKGDKVLQGPGENAGLIDIGNDYALAFKIESHNHPSFIEPTQGAATGVGGILRDIFTMGARPIAVLDSLHFGSPTAEKTSFLYHGVVAGIAGYGNCMGIPTVGGEVFFDESYNGNNLVNAMAVGLMKKQDIHKGIAQGEGNVVLYLGSATGRDGIHGATMASEEFGEGSEERRPTVQVGDPFAEKRLMEASLEIMQKRLVVGIQDMGAAGITCSTFEMSSRGQVGMEIQLDSVPLRDSTLTAYEIFLSESQERMLAVATPDNVPAIMEIARRWEIDCADIGVVTNTKRVEAYYKGEKVVDLPVDPITEAAPLYERPWVDPVIATQIVAGNQVDLPITTEMILEFVSRPNLCSRKAVFERYDYSVGTDTVFVPGSDAAVMRVKGLPLGLAFSVDSNSFYCQSDPYQGAMHTIAEVVRNLACTGARAVSMTNCLNFGNPEIPEVMGQFREVIKGLSEACIYFQTPITGGNVSLYNQTEAISIKPTPTIGMVGILDDINNRVPSQFVAESEEVYLLGNSLQDIYESEFSRAYLGKKNLKCPPVDLKAERNLQEALLELSKTKTISSAHDCSIGGLITTLAEACLGKKTNIGASLTLPQDANMHALLFGEYGARAVVSCSANRAAKMLEVLAKHGVPTQKVGSTGGSSLKIENIGELPLEALRTSREKFFSEL